MVATGRNNTASAKAFQKQETGRDDETIVNWKDRTVGAAQTTARVLWCTVLLNHNM